MIFVVIIVIQRKRHRPLKIHCTNHIQISIWRSICLPFRLAIHRGFGNRFVGFAIHLRAIIKQLFCKKQFTKITTIATQHLPYLSRDDQGPDMGYDLITTKNNLLPVLHRNPNSSKIWFVSININ